MIPVNKPFLPPLKEYTRFLEEIWENGQLTNHGPLVRELEKKIAEIAEVEHAVFTANGTLALQIAIKACGLKNEVITTPISYIATTSSLVWENCKPVYAAVNPQMFTIDPESIPALINHSTSGILATHLFGNCCDLEKLAEIASEYKLKLIYDAAHSFGVQYRGHSILSYGDASAISFHATKLFHTVEGGAILTKNTEIATRAIGMRNFGITENNDYSLPGINAKGTEFHAAMGLCILPHLDGLMQARSFLSTWYDKKLFPCNGISKMQYHPGITRKNHSFYPLRFDSEFQLLKTQSELEKNEIASRRYTYPSLDSLSYTDNRKMESSDLAGKILCLPFYPGLSPEEVQQITTIIKNSLKI